MVQIIENLGYKDQALLDYLSSNKKVAEILASRSLAFVARDGKVSFPMHHTPEEEKADARAADEGFRARVGKHTVAVGLTAGAIAEDRMFYDTQVPVVFAQVAALHDLGKIEEIRLRGPFEDANKAYKHAGLATEEVLRNAGYRDKFVQISGFVGHEAAAKYLMNPKQFGPTMFGEMIYIADELHEETRINELVEGKVNRLDSDPKYAENNNLGFPEFAGIRLFVNPDGTLRTKYSIQREATKKIAANLAEDMGIANWEDLGTSLIKRQTKLGLYEAVIID